MSRPHIITISGKPGSGKSSTAREVAKLLGYEHISAGKLVRQMAKENGISLKELNDRAASDNSIDKRVDHYIQGLRSKNNVVVDSRLGFHWIPRSFKVYLELDSEIAVARIFRDLEKEDDRSGESANTIDDVWDEIKMRTDNERGRFKKLYNVDPFKGTNYDLIIHTERNNPMTVALWVHDRYQTWLSQENWKQIIERVPLGYSET
jgi:cytidylate kinase